MSVVCVCVSCVCVRERVSVYCLSVCVNPVCLRELEYSVSVCVCVESISVCVSCYLEFHLRGEGFIYERSPLDLFLPLLSEVVVLHVLLFLRSHLPQFFICQFLNQSLLSRILAL